MRELFESRGIHLHVSGIKLPVETVMRKAGVLYDSPLLSMYRTDAEALQAFDRIALAEGEVLAAQVVDDQGDDGSDGERDHRPGGERR